MKLIIGDDFMSLDKLKTETKKLEYQIKKYKYNLEGDVIRFDDDEYAIYREGDWKHKYKLYPNAITPKIPINEIARTSLLNDLEDIHELLPAISSSVDYITEEEDEEYLTFKMELEKMNVEIDKKINLQDPDYLIYKVVPWTKNNTHWQRNPIYKPHNKAAKEFARIH